VIFVMVVSESRATNNRNTAHHCEVFVLELSVSFKNFAYLYIRIYAQNTFYPQLTVNAMLYLYRKW